MFGTIFYNPLYNALILILDHIPGGNVAVATIILTCLVKLILFPISKNAAKTQIKMKILEPEIAKIREQYSKDPQALAQKTMDFYKKNDLNPFAGFFLLLIQLPIILALASIFYRGGLPAVNVSLLYSFVHNPTSVNTIFLGMDVAKSSLVLGILAGLSQFFQIRLTMPAMPSKPAGSGAQSFGNDFAQSMNLQMRYVMPVIIFIICLKISGAVAIYWITGSLFMICQELYFRRTVKKGFVPVK